MPQLFNDLILSVTDRIKATNTSVVLAESCTAGLVSACLSRTPGISQILCGSAVVYQEATKSAWLGVSPSLLASDGAVSEKVASAMAVGVLERTPAANLSASITGHLGPGAPSEQDGLIYVGIARRTSQGCEVSIFRHVLPAEIGQAPLAGVESLREWRQWKAVEVVLNHLLQALPTGDQQRN